MSVKSGDATVTAYFVTSGEASLCSTDGYPKEKNFRSLLGRLQIWIPGVHGYLQVRIGVRAPEITRVEPHSIEPLGIFPPAKSVGVRENVAANAETSPGQLAA